GDGGRAPLVAPARMSQNQPRRQIVPTPIAGRAVRVRFSNAIGSVPLTIDAASVGIRQLGADVVAGTLRPLTFGGATSITIPPHATAASDAVSLRVGAESDLAISVFLANATPGPTQLKLSHQTSFLSRSGP